MSAPTASATDPAALRAALLRYVRSRVADPATAEDLVHDIFLRATRQQHHVREDGAYVGWLFRIARNRIIDHYRARKPTPVRSCGHRTSRLTFLRYLAILPSIQESKEGSNESRTDHRRQLL